VPVFASFHPNPGNAAEDYTLSFGFPAGRRDFQGGGSPSGVPPDCAKRCSAAMAWSIVSRSARRRLRRVRPTPATVKCLPMPALAEAEIRPTLDD
jgi:hypothetical protein